MRKMDDVRLQEHKETARDMFSARSLLAKVIREHIHKRQNLSEPTVNEIVQHFREGIISDEDLENYADDGLGEVFLGLSVLSDEDSESENERRVRRRTENSE